MKISASAAGKERRRKLGRWLKGTAAVAAGTGVGTGIYMLGHAAAQKHLPKYWAKLSPQMRTAILGAGSGIAGLGSAALAKKLLHEKREYEK